MTKNTLGTIGATWGIAGVLVLIGTAIVHLTSVGLDAFDYPLQMHHWAFLVAFLLFMLISEGYQGFQKSFAPQVAARARELQLDPRLLQVLLAPLVCMGFIYATPRRMLRSYALAAMIVIFVLIVRQLPQPWRGLLDIGVAAGLLWGVVALIAFAYRVFGAPVDRESRV
jgi:hypothetical protein